MLPLPVHIPLAGINKLLWCVMESLAIGAFDVRELDQGEAGIEVTVDVFTISYLLGRRIELSILGSSSPAAAYPPAC